MIVNISIWATLTAQAELKDAKIVATVHDEVLLEVHKQKAQEYSAIVKNIMSKAGKESLLNLPWRGYSQLLHGKSRVILALLL